MFTQPTGEWTVQPDGMVVMGRGGAASGISQNPLSFENAAATNGQCFFQLPVDQCVANLKLHPCQATVQELDDCFLSLFFEGGGWLIRPRCTAFRATPSCSETIVSATLPDTGSKSAICELPVR